MRRVLMLVFALLAWPPIAADAAAERLRHGGVLFKPLGWVEDGRPQGPLLLALARIYERAGIEPEWNEVSPARLGPGFADGSYHVGIVVLGALGEHRDAVSVSPMPTTHIVLDAYMLGEDPQVRRPEDLVGRRVIVQPGYSYGRLRAFMEDPVNRIAIAAEVRDTLAGLRVLAMRRGDLFLAYRPMADDALLSLGKVDIRRSPVQKVAVHAVVSKRTPDAERVMQRLIAARAALLAEGKLPELIPSIE